MLRPDDVKQVMRHLFRCFNDGDFPGAVERLEGLLSVFKGGLPYDTALRAAIGCHQHLGQLRRYVDKFKEQEAKRGFAIHGEKLLQLLGECGRVLGKNADGNVLLVSEALQADSLIQRREFDAALGVLTNDEDGYCGFLRTICLFELGRLPEANTMLAACRSRPTIFDYVDMDWDILRHSKISGEVEQRARKIRSKRWLSSANAPLDKLLEDQIHKWSGGPRGIMSRADRTVTVGSCFASNLAYALEREGMDAGSFTFAEDVNNTYANRTFFEQVLAFIDTGQDDKFCGQPISDCHRRISQARVLIFTSGTSIGFFDSENRPVIPRAQSAAINAIFFEETKARKITVSENVENLRFIIAAARIINPDIKIVLTVSPVPLGRSFEEDSALIGDCVSKSTLRVAVDEVLGDGIPDVYYWPSFEIAKWILPHYGGEQPKEMFYGAEDDFSKHPAKAMVEMIVAAFLSYALVESPEA
jgi:hypothetical protein